MAALAVVALAVSGQLALAGLLFVLVAWWVWAEPELGFLFFVVLAPLLPLLKATQIFDEITLVKDIIILALAGRVIGYPLLTKRLPYRRLELIWPLTILAGWVVIGLWRADNQVLGVLRARDLLLYPLLYLVAAYLPVNKKVWRERLGWWLGSATVVLLLGAYQWWLAADSAVLRFDPVRVIWIPRLSATLVHPSIYGQYLVLLVTLLVVLGWYHRRWRLAAALLGLAGLVSIYLTYSRGVWLGLAGGLASMGIVVVRQWSRKRVVSVLIPVVLVAVLLMAITPAGTFLRSSFDPTYSSNEIRLEFLARLISSLSNSEALFGKGLGDVVAQNFREVDVRGSEIVLGEARAVQLAKDMTLVDNQYLKTLVELGFFGLLIYVWLYWRLARSAYRAVSHNQLTRQVLGRWSWGWLVAFIIQAFFIDIWDIFPTNAAFWLMAGLLAATSSKTAAEFAPGFHRPERPVSPA